MYAGGGHRMWPGGGRHGVGGDLAGQDVWAETVEI